MIEAFDKLAALGAAEAEAAETDHEDLQAKAARLRAALAGLLCFGGS